MSGDHDLGYKGVEQGELAGRRFMLKLQLADRFDLIPPTVVAGIESANLAELACWSERILDAGTIADVFAPLPP